MSAFDTLTDECEYCNGIRHSFHPNGLINNPVYKAIPAGWWEKKCLRCDLERGQHYLSHPHASFNKVACHAYTGVLDESFEA